MIAILAAALGGALLLPARGAVATPGGPCDITGAHGNPCVAAHSTTRALFAAYDGPLYEVTRPDGKSANVGVLVAGGYANIKTHDGKHPVARV